MGAPDVGASRRLRTRKGRRHPTPRVTFSPWHGTALKMGCPRCGSSRSKVIRSRGAMSSDTIPRTRVCTDCRLQFPTAERLDRVVYARQQQARGELLPTAYDLPPATWAHAEQFLAQLRDDGRHGEYRMCTWRAFEAILAALRAAHS